MKLTDLFNEGTVPPLIVKRVDKITEVSYHDLVPLPGATMEDLEIEVNVEALSESEKQDFRRTLLNTFNEKKWKRYTVTSALLHTKQMNNSFLVQFGGTALVYDMDLESKPIIVKMLKKYRNK